MWDLLENPEDRFSQNEAQYLDIQNLCCKHSKTQTKRLYHGVLSQKDADGIEKTLIRMLLTDMEHSDLGLHSYPDLSFRKIGSIWYLATKVLFYA